MLNFKRALIIGTMLTALSAQAFAAPAVENAPAPTMKERVNAILNEDNTVCPAKGNNPCPQPGMRHHKNLKLTPEQRKVVDKYRGQWKDMTPEQRKAAGQEIFTVMTKDMTPEQRAAIRANTPKKYNHGHKKHHKQEMRAQKQAQEVTATKVA